MSSIKVGLITEIAEGKMKKYSVGDKEIVVANVEGKFYAIAAKCPHMGGPLVEGKLEGCIITCPWHKAAFDFRTGEAVADAVVAQKHIPVKPVITYRIEIKAGEIFVEV